MFESFKTILLRLLSTAQGKLIVAVSGGVDSMVMLHLLQRTDYELVVVHIDHGTRGGQSSADAAFVKEYCDKNGINIYTKVLDATHFEKGNFHDVARKIRYEYFNEILKQEEAIAILTAHHIEDRWETVLQHMAKAAGLRGITSLREREGLIVRPLLHFHKSALMSYAANHEVPFVTDLSNLSNDYTRNYIRNEVTPLLVDKFPSFIHQVNKTLQYLEKDRDTLSYLLEERYVEDSEWEMKVNVEKIITAVHPEHCLFTIISRYGFTASDAADILQCETGAEFFTTQYEGLRDRKHLYIRHRCQASTVHLEITEPGEFSLAGNKLCTVQVASGQELGYNIDFPFIIRTWRPGDKMKPKGMHGKSKKIKDILTDAKYSKWKKQQTFVVVKEQQIVAILGDRVAEGVKDNAQNGIVIKINEPLSL